MNIAVVFHNIGDVDHYFKNNVISGEVFFTTHYSCTIYADKEYKMQVTCLSDFLQDDDILKLRDFVFKEVNQYVDVLDDTIGRVINQKFDLEMKYFRPLYSYWGKIYLHGLMCVIDALEKVNKKYSINEWKIYDYHLNYEYPQKLSLNDLIPIFLPKFKCQFLKSQRVNDNVKKFQRYKLQKIIKGLYKYIKNKIKSQESKKFELHKKNILLSNPLYDLEFLRGALIEYNVVFYNDGNKNKIESGVPEVSLPTNSEEIVQYTSNPLGRMFIENVLHDFQPKFKQYIGSILDLNRFQEKHPISLAIWGNPPVYGTKALIYEYLNSKKVPVLGCQHGASHIDQIVPWSIDSQYNRCTHFISYGFTDEDRRRSFPREAINSITLPYGKVVEPVRNSKKQKVDLVFPLTNNISMFDGGMKSISSGALGARQKDIIDLLGKTHQLTIYVKPVRQANSEKFAFREYLNDFSNLQAIYNLSLKEFMDKYKPRAVLIEYPSTPLYQVLNLDTEMFLMTDPINPFERQAYNELEKRVYIADNMEQLHSYIQEFSQGKLKPKRDNTFYNHYIHKNNREKNILDFIHSQVREKNKSLCLN